VHSQDQTGIGKGEYAVAPDETDDDPGRKVYEGNAKMPGANELLSVIMWNSMEEDACIILTESRSPIALI
jgi:hypothetical protein